MGRSSHDLGHNLYLRVERMAAHLPPAARPEAKPPAERRVSVAEYFHFVLDHPRVAAAHSARDLAVLGFKSGLNRLVLDYLDLFPKSRERLQDSASGWRVQVERHGLLRGLAAILKASPALTLTSLAGALLFAFFMGLAALGAYAWLRDTSIAPATRRLRILLIVFVLYIIATAQVVDAAQSRHRHPAEFALCLIAVAGLPLLTHRRRRRHGA
jgi:hypothetical protein